MSRVGEAIYRLCLRAFPSQSRARFADEMVQMLSEQRMQLAGRPMARASLWLRAVWDALTNGFGARFRGTRVTETPPPNRNRRRGAINLFRDARFALRGLARAPGVTAVAVIALALGIGVNAALFSVVHTVLLAPLPYPDADRIVLLWLQNPGFGSVSLSPSQPDVDRWRNARGLSSIVQYAGQPFTLDDGNAPDVVNASLVDVELFAFANIKVGVGRAFTPADAVSSASARVMLLSDQLWSKRYGRDRGVIGRTVDLNEVRYQIVGVMPAWFHLPTGKAELFLPLPPPEMGPNNKPRYRPVSAMARLSPGVSVATAQAELTSLLSPERAKWTAYLMAPETMTGEVMRHALQVLTGAVACVLLIACANVAHLLLARNASRRREFAVRAALGASRGRLVAQLMTETVLLAAIGGVAGAGLAALLLAALSAWRPEDLRQLEFVRLGWQTGVFLAAISVAAGVLIGWLPAWSAARRAVTDTRSEGTRTVGERRGRLIRLGLSVAELALALVLVAGAGLLLRSYARVADANLGFSTAGNVTAEIELPPTRYRTQPEQKLFFDRLLTGLRAVPGVERVLIATSIPPNGGLYFGDIEIEGAPKPDGPTRYDGGGVGPGFFEALRVPMVEGRGFVDSDLTPGSNVAVVSASTAKKFWPDASAIGKRLRLGGHIGAWTTVVGVAANIRTQISDLESTQIFTPTGGESGFGVVLIHTAPDRNSMARAIAAARTQIQTLDPKLPLGRIETLDDSVFRSNVRPRFNALLLGILAGVGLVLAASGVYGVINYSVGLRTRELGVRIALGATPRDLGRAVLAEAAVVGAAGVGIGLGAWMFLGTLMRSLLYNLEPTDVVTLAAVAIVLIATTIIAAWIPARRATIVDPVVALRD